MVTRRLGPQVSFASDGTSQDQRSAGTRHPRPTGGGSLLTSHPAGPAKDMGKHSLQGEAAAAWFMPTYEPPHPARPGW